MADIFLVCLYRWCQWGKWTLTEQCREKASGERDRCRVQTGSSECQIFSGMGLASLAILFLDSISFLFAPQKYFLFSLKIAPPSFVEWPESLTRPRAGTARFVCQAEGIPSPKMSWLKNGRKIHSNGRIKMYNRWAKSLCYYFR